MTRRADARPSSSSRLSEASRKKYVQPVRRRSSGPRRSTASAWFIEPRARLAPRHGGLGRARRGRRGSGSPSSRPSTSSASTSTARSALMEGLARRLYAGGGDSHRLAYLHHFLDEENKHMVCFGGFCTRYAGKIYPDRKVAFPREYARGRGGLPVLRQGARLRGDRRRLQRAHGEGRAARAARRAAST